MKIQDILEQIKKSVVNTGIKIAALIMFIMCLPLSHVDNNTIQFNNKSGYMKIIFCSVLFITLSSIIQYLLLLIADKLGILIIGDISIPVLVVISSLIISYMLTVFICELINNITNVKNEGGMSNEQVN